MKPLELPGTPPCRVVLDADRFDSVDKSKGATEERKIRVGAYSYTQGIPKGRTRRPLTLDKDSQFPKPPALTM